MSVRCAYAVGVAAAVQNGVGPQAATAGAPVMPSRAMPDSALRAWKWRLGEICSASSSFTTTTAGNLVSYYDQPRSAPLTLQENLRYDRVAEAWRHGEYVAHRMSSVGAGTRLKIG